MPTPNKGPRMGGSPAHERLMLANLATSLFEHGRITTTEAKAKRLRPYAEHLITFGKRGDLHARRQVLKRLRDKSVVHTLFAEIGPRYVDRPGGYTRILKLGNRKGDNAPMAIIELVEALTVGQSAVGEAERARGTQVAPKQGPDRRDPRVGRGARRREPDRGRRRCRPLRPRRGSRRGRPTTPTRSTRPSSSADRRPPTSARRDGARRRRRHGRVDRGRRRGRRPTSADAPTAPDSADSPDAK